MWPPRPNVPSTYTPERSGATSAAIVSANMAGVCVPNACSVARTPNVLFFATVTETLRPPNRAPSRFKASFLPASSTKVMKPAPLACPD